MPHFKDENNKLYWLDDNDEPSVWFKFKYIQITDEEAEQIRNSYVENNISLENLK